MDSACLLTTQSRHSVSEGMSPQFLAMLPGELQATVQEAEQVAECAIEVVPDATANEFDNLTLRVDDGVCRATIAYRGESISRIALLHEVLHVKRYWLNAVPILKPAARFRYESDAQMIDELIEHLIIIPEERRFLEAESNAHWSSVMANELPRVSFPSSQAERRSLMLQRAMMDIALPDLDHTRLYGRLCDENLLESSATFIDRLRNMLDDKERALICVSREFRYDVTAFCVGRFNVRANPKSFERSPLVQ
jgi:hypothetical protein